uniref:uncharacterized protein LOC124054758 isoform X2 n=1 Tax=Scatophagus argus TaxID=75038 RepID=UPI001ED834E9|nr:uncharacterized protein LOC124054758 isoform X2 [Scatophagus argus]
MMTQGLISELFIVSLVALLLVLMVLLVLCWVLRRNRSRNLTELKISAGQSTGILTIRTEPDHADQLLDRLLDRVFIQEAHRPGSGDKFEREPRAEPGQELGGECGSCSGPDPEDSSAASSSRGVTEYSAGVTGNPSYYKLWKATIVASPPAATPPASPSPANQDHMDNPIPQLSGAAKHVSFSSLDSFYYYWDEEQHDQSQL